MTLPSTFVLLRLAGGLGNQMFQYAAGRAVALATGRRLLLDATAIPRGPSDRRYELPAFRIAGEPAGPVVRTLVRAQVGARLPGAMRGIARAASRRRWTLLGDRDSGFDERLFATAGDLVLEGPWQLAAYADHTPEIRAAIRRELSPRGPLPERLTGVIAEIEACEAVCVHVRRGDYAHDPAVAAVHGTLPLDYYDAAAARLADHVAAPFFFVFSDDAAWARRNLRLPGPMRVVDEAADLPPSVDQRLMAACRHFIIANSTFSWWAAWLGANPAKLVVAPRQWFANRVVPAGLLPESWMVV